MEEQNASAGALTALTAKVELLEKQVAVILTLVMALNVKAENLNGLQLTMVNRLLGPDPEPQYVGVSLTGKYDPSDPD